jgi:hypothetical protein
MFECGLRDVLVTLCKIYYLEVELDNLETALRCLASVYWHIERSLFLILDDEDFYYYDLLIRLLSRVVLDCVLLRYLLLKYYLIFYALLCSINCLKLFYCFFCANSSTIFFYLLTKLIIVE